MTECLFQYDRLYLNAAYHEPDEHRYLLSHMIIGVSQRVRCSVNHYEFEADGVCIVEVVIISKDDIRFIFKSGNWTTKGRIRQ